MLARAATDLGSAHAVRAPRRTDPRRTRPVGAGSERGESSLDERGPVRSWSSMAGCQSSRWGMAAAGTARSARRSSLVALLGRWAMAHRKRLSDVGKLTGVRRERRRHDEKGDAMMRASAPGHLHDHCGHAQGSGGGDREGDDYLHASFSRGVDDAVLMDLAVRQRHEPLVPRCFGTIGAAFSRRTSGIVY